MFEEKSISFQIDVFSLLFCRGMYHLDLAISCHRRHFVSYMYIFFDLFTLVDLIVTSFTDTIK